MTNAVLQFDAANDYLVSSTFLHELDAALAMTQMSDRDPNHPHELPLGFINY